VSESTTPKPGLAKRSSFLKLSHPLIHSLVSKGRDAPRSSLAASVRVVWRDFAAAIPRSPQSVGRPDLRSVTLYSRAIARERSRNASPPFG
jgi:hypothetical protein